MSERRSARARVDDLLDPGWRALFEDVGGGDPLGFAGYGAQLADARRRTGATESVLVAEGALGRARPVVVAFEFGFLGGSMGVAAGERICRAFETAAAERRPLVALIATGGARMQEGMRALAQMPATVAAREALARAHQPFIAFLLHPTTGGVYASFASGADLIWAEPGATVAFAGPRVAEAVTGEPTGARTAEDALAAGLIDEIVAPEDLRARSQAVLGVLDGRDTAGPPPPPPAAPTDDAERDPWERVGMVRDRRRPSGPAYPELVARIASADPALIAGLATIGPHTAVTMAFDARGGTGRPGPGAFRAARRSIEIGARLDLPIVTFIDTPGAEPGDAAERAGIAHEISATMRALLGAPVPTVACVVGEGGSGGALALACCDRLLIQRNAIFSVIGPEGAAAILRRDDVDEVARDLRLTAQDLLEAGLADRILAEPPGGAQADHEAARAIVLAAVAHAIDEATVEGAPSARRVGRFRRPWHGP